MARFLLTVWPIQSHLDPFMAVAQGLRRRGHEVAFYIGTSCSVVVEKEGFRCFTFQAVDERKVDGLVRGIVSRTWRPGRWRDFLLSTIPDQIRDLEAVWSRWQPHALLCDMAMWGPILVLQESKKVPVAILSHVATCMLPGPENPLPGMNWLLDGRWARACTPAIVRIVTSGVPRAASRLRKRYGLPPLSVTVTEFTGTLPLYLLPSMPEFDGERRDLPSSVHYVGPCLWDKNRDEPPPAWVSQAPRDRPCVVVTEGDIQLCA